MSCISYKKELRKPIYTWGQLRKNICRNPSTETEIHFKIK